jgi:hypothetical protein
MKELSGLPKILRLRLNKEKARPAIAGMGRNTS